MWKIILEPGRPSDDNRAHAHFTLGNKGYKHIIYNKSTRCNSGSIVFINNYKYALHVLDALCVHHQEHYKL